MIDYLSMLKEFHTKYNHYMQMRPFWPPADVIQLRDDLIDEEATEFCEAETIEKIADALADLLYVTFGAALAYGIPIEEIFLEVHKSNMTKSMDKSKMGKTSKGPEFVPPDIKSILAKHGLV